MGMQIERECVTRAYTCPTTTPASTSAQMINTSGASAVSVFIPTGRTITSLAFWAMDKEGGTPLAVYNNSNAAVTLTVTNGRCYWIPEELFAFPFIGMVANAAEEVLIGIKK